MPDKTKEREAQVRESLLVLNQLAAKVENLRKRGHKGRPYFVMFGRVEGVSKGEEMEFFDDDSTYEAFTAASILLKKLDGSIKDYIKSGSVTTLKESCQTAIGEASILNDSRGFFGKILQNIVKAVNKLAQCFGKGETWIQIPQTASAAIVQNFKDQLIKDIPDEPGSSSELKK